MNTMKNNIFYDKKINTPVKTSVRIVKKFFFTYHHIYPDLFNTIIYFVVISCLLLFKQSIIF